MISNPAYGPLITELMELTFESDTAGLSDHWPTLVNAAVPAINSKGSSATSNAKLANIARRVAEAETDARLARAAARVAEIAEAF